MNLFNMFDKNSKEIVDSVEKRKNKPEGKLFKIIKTISILGVFASIGIFVLGFFGVLGFNAPTFGIIGTIISLCVGSWLMLPWVAYFEQEKYKKTATVFIGLDISVPLLWIFSIWLLVGKISAGTIGAGTLNFTKAVILITLQFSVVSFIANTILRYGKKLLAIQIVAYISYIYIDFYLSYALSCISFGGENFISFSGALVLLGNKLLVALLTLALLYVIISKSIINGGRRRKRRLGDTIDDILPEEKVITEAPVAEKKESKKENPEEQLRSLQNLLDKNLITKEEYEEKRKSILEKL